MTTHKRILVTGGAGFLGSHLCKTLVQQGHDVLCLDNLYTGFRGNIADLLTEPNFELIRHDITEPIWLEVDGGVKVSNIREIAEAGIDTFVAGSAIFGARDADGGYAGVLAALRRELAGAADAQRRAA